ncbi:MAG: hypothetical protein CMF28_03790 [Kiritimatiellaceae bacterium]|nr:hypothetical protein [Kiritimatiellaceae bacterium]
MKVEIFALCDAATESQGKLNLLGTFDQLVAGSVPVVHPACAVAIRIRFEVQEAVEHQIRLHMVDPDGQLFMKSMGASIRPRFGGDVSSAAVNLILQLQRIKFDLFADYALRLEVDDEEVASLPLRVASLR